MPLRSQNWTYPARNAACLVIWLVAVAVSSNLYAEEQATETPASIPESELLPNNPLKPNPLQLPFVREKAEPAAPLTQGELEGVEPNGQSELIPLPILNAMDTPRDYLANELISLVGNIDRFFGDDRNFQENNNSVFQFDLSRMAGYSGDSQYVLSGRAKLHLPNTEQRLHLTFESNPDQNPAADPSKTSKQPNPANSLIPKNLVDTIAAALRFEGVSGEHVHFSTDAGLQFQGLNTTPFTRARGSIEDSFDLWRVKATETLFWFNTIGAGESTQLDVERFISDPLLFRATSNATWMHDSQHLDLRQNLSLYQAWSDRTGLLYQASAIGIGRPQIHVTDYVLLFSYRHRLHRDWLFLELTPQVHFPIDKHFHSSPAFLLRLEMLFSETK